MNATPESASPNGKEDSSSSTAKHFRLTGPTPHLDARTHAWRRDLADIALAGQVIAPYYARPLVRACGVIATPVRIAPNSGATALSELLPGEEFAVLEYAGGWAWGYCRPDQLVGYVEAIELAAPIETTHIVCEKYAPVTADDRITSTVLASFPMGARLHGQECGACLSTEYGCVPLSHLRRVEDHDDDPAAVAERLLGALYLAGGRTFKGVDDCGLVQLAYSLCGLPAPRDREGQSALGDAVPEGKKPARGDLIVFEEGAALMIDDQMLIHASRAEKRVGVEPLRVVADRTPIIARRRIN